MASNYTNNYNLCQWAASDRVLRTEFNADNSKIDAAIKAVDARVDNLNTSKASTSQLNTLQTSLNSLQTTVNGLKTSKADKTALESLKTTVTQHTSTLSQKGNCQFYTTSYTGTGEYGSEHPNSLSFPLKPMLIMIVSPTGSILDLFYGQTQGTYNGVYFPVVWSGNSVKWSHPTGFHQQMNAYGLVYHVLALLKTD